MFKIGDRVRLIDAVKHFIKPPADRHGWFTLEKRADTEAPDWWLLLEDTHKVTFHEREMIKAKKPTIIII